MQLSSQTLSLSEKLNLLADAAKYDVACTSSGVNRAGKQGHLGNSVSCGICHSFSSDGRCISLLKILQSNDCIYDCKYCVNRAGNDRQRATFTPEEVCTLVTEFYRRNYIEGLFLSSAVCKNPAHTMELMYRTLHLLRNRYRFNGYIHVKAIPGADPLLIRRMGLLADRMSVNIELPSERSLTQLAPDKSKQSILKPMAAVRDRVAQSRHELAVYRHAPSFAPGGQSTQMIIGATPDTDYQIMKLASGLYRKYALKRVFYSAYIPVGTHALLPKDQPPPLLREHRLYQTDWLLRFYGFQVEEILDERHPSLDPLLDPKCNWALHHLDRFPVEVNRADREMLLRVPGIGVKSADRILSARRVGSLSFDDLKKIGVVLKRAIYFITCKGRMADGTRLSESFIYQNLTADIRLRPGSLPLTQPVRQLTFDDLPQLSPGKEDRLKCLTGQM